MESYAVRVTHPQTTVKHIIASWSTQCEKIVAYEHVGDVTEKVHSHLLMINCRVGKKQLRNIAANCGVNVKGQESLSFKAYDSNERYLTYMSKGNLSPWYLQGFTAEECEEARKLWVPDQKKQSPLVKFYNKFEASLDVKSEAYKSYILNAINLGSKLEDVRFEWIRAEAYKFAFNESDRIASHAMAQKYKMLVNTYCMRYHVAMGGWKGNYYV